MTDSLVLAGDFASPSRQDWDAEVLKVLNRKRPPGTEIPLEKAMARLRTTTVDGLVIEPLYTAGDAAPAADGLTPVRSAHLPPEACGTSGRCTRIPTWPPPTPPCSTT